MAKKITLNDVREDLRSSLRNFPNLPLEYSLCRSFLHYSMVIFNWPDLSGVSLKIIKKDNFSLRVFRPNNGLKSSGLLYWIHGGGYMMGAASQDDGFCAKLCRELGILVVSVDYRLAPRFPFPAPLDDCYEGFKWIQQSASLLNIDPNQIVIAGGSAGGALATNLTFKLIDKSQIIHGLMLFSPALDDRTAANKELDKIENFVWNNSNNRVAWKSYLNMDPGQDEVPPYSVAARRNNLKGLPKTWISIGTIDLFYEENCRFVDRLKETAIDITFIEMKQAFHGFEFIVPNNKINEEYLFNMTEWLRQLLGIKSSR